MDALGDLLDPDSDWTVVECPGHPSRSITLGQFTRTCWKTGNYLRHLGVRPGTTVAVANDLAPEPLYTLFGTALLGARVRFGSAGDDWRAFVGPTADLLDRSTPPGAKRVAYGDRPSDPSVAHFGTDVWSENPAFPDTEVGGEDPLLETEESTLSHGDLLDAATAVADTLSESDVVAVRASLTQPGAVVAGVLAPLCTGAAILLPDGEGVGTVAVTDGDSPESRVIAPDDAC